MTATYETLKKQLDDLMALARGHWGRAVGRAPELRLDLRGTSAGQACSGRLIRLNQALLDDHPEQWEPTLIHELAHIITQRLFPRAKPHGWQWRQINAELGGASEVSHRLDVSAHRQRVLDYFEYVTADGNQIWLSVIRHKRAQRNLRRRSDSGYQTPAGVAICHWTGRMRKGPPG